MQGQIVIKLFCYCTFSRQWVLAGGSLFWFFILSNSEFSFSFISIMNKNVTSRPWKSILRLAGTANLCADAGTSWTRQVEVFLLLLRSSTVTLRARWVSCNWNFEPGCIEFLNVMTIVRVLNWQAHFCSSRYVSFISYSVVWIPLRTIWRFLTTWSNLCYENFMILQ